MTDKEKLEKLKELADAMYYAAQYLTTDASRLHKAMEEYHQFIIHEYFKEEPVSESNEELAETYLAVFNKKFPILPILSGKQLADYKNFLNKCQQIFGLKEWGIRPIQSKLFEKLTLLWAAWGAEHLQGVGRQDEKEQDTPVSEDLDSFAIKYAQDKPYPVTVCQAVKAGANYVLEQIEKLTSNQNWYAFPKQSYKELKELIEQLKK